MQIHPETAKPPAGAKNQKTLSIPYGGILNIFKLIRLIAAALVLLAASASGGAWASGARPIVISVLGDSLTAGFGLARGQAFPARLEAALKAEGHAVEVRNAGVSGDTAEDGLARLDWAIGPDVQAVIVELGANDALRGQTPQRMRKALETILMRLKARRLPVLLAGMKAPRNLGPDYTRAYDRVFPELAEQYGAIFYPFFLEGVATDPALNLPDGLHPNTKGVARIVENILPHARRLMDQAASAATQ